MSDEEAKSTLPEGNADTEPPPDPLGWARALVDEQSYCLHAPSRTISRAKRLFGPGEYVSPMNQKPVTSPVLAMEDGNTFVAEEGVFVPLARAEAEFYLEAQKVVGVAAKTCAVEGSKRDLRRETCLMLVGVALRQTAAVVEAVQWMPTPPKGGTGTDG